MPVNKDRTFDVPLDEETMKRAEEMCSGLSLSLSIERRGQTHLYEGMLDDLSVMDRRAKKVKVAEVLGEDYLTLLSPEALGSSSHALLVFRTQEAQTRKLLGRHPDSRPARRETDAPGTTVVTFSIESEVQ